VEPHASYQPPCSGSDPCRWVRGRVIVAILPPILKDQRDGFSEVLQSRRLRPPLAIGSGDLRTVGNMPAAISFYDGGKLTPHVPILAPRSSRKLDWGRNWPDTGSPRRTRQSPESARASRRHGREAPNRSCAAQGKPGSRRFADTEPHGLCHVQILAIASSHPSTAAFSLRAWSGGILSSCSWGGIVVQRSLD